MTTLSTFLLSGYKTICHILVSRDYVFSCLHTQRQYLYQEPLYFPTKCLFLFIHIIKTDGIPGNGKICTMSFQQCYKDTCTLLILSIILICYFMMDHRFWLHCKLSGVHLQTHTYLSVGFKVMVG